MTQQTSSPALGRLGSLETDVGDQPALCQQDGFCIPAHAVLSEPFLVVGDWLWYINAWRRESEAIDAMCTI